MLEYDLFEESKRNDRSNASIVLVGYTHMIKYYVCKNKQDSDWIKSINNMVTALSKISSSEKTKLVVQLDDLYNKARKNAHDELKEKGYQYFTNVCPIEIPNDFMFKNISDHDVMDKWLRDNAYSEMVIKRLKIEKVLNAAEKHFIEHPEFTLSTAFPGIK